MTTHHTIALIPGDGVGKEVLPPAVSVLESIASRHGISFTFEEFDWSCERYLRSGEMMPVDGLDRIRHVDSILLGAVGWPGVPDHVSLWGLLIPIRRTFDQYINLRPIKLLDGVPGPLRADLANGTDFVVVRENVEGEYGEVGGRLYRGFPEEMAVQESMFTRRGVIRVVDFAFALAQRRRGILTSATKSNGIVHTMPFWDELVHERAALHPEIDWNQEHIDALVAKIVLRPTDYDVVVGSNLFGDILSDLAAAVAGSIGIAPAANLNPERLHPSMFEPVHGSAPDIAGQGIANPVGALWSTAMMLDHLGHSEASNEILSAVFSLLAETDVRTRDLGGIATTAEFTDAVLDRLSASAGAHS